jgi:hypothetical protein
LSFLNRQRWIAATRGPQFVGMGLRTSIAGVPAMVAHLDGR